MLYDEDFLESPHAKPIAYRAWRCRKPIANLLLVHGMAEHCGRYGLFGETLTDHNINLVSFDLPGHGEHCDDDYLGQLDQWGDLGDSVKAVWRQVALWEPDIPVYLMGCSMGAYVSLDVLHQTLDRLPAGVILCGAGLQNRFELWRGLQAARFERWRQGPEGKSQLLNTLSFQKFNAVFKPNQTEFDWLSRDAAEVKAYVDDPWCGFKVSNQFWLDLIAANFRYAQRGAFDSYPTTVPTLLICGGQDPVSRFGTGINLLAEALGRDKMADLTTTIYPEARHELLNELNRETVMTDIVQWITARVTAQIPL